MSIHFVTDEKIAETSSKGNQENGLTRLQISGTSLTSSDMRH